MTANVRNAEYTALSYKWDHSNQSQKVWLNSEQIEISMNLSTFLQRTQRRSMNTLYWIHEICIQQRDVLEKQHQVMLMHEIYRHAAQIVVMSDSAGQPVSSGIYSPMTLAV